MSLLRVKNGGEGGEGSGVMPTMRPVSMGRPLVTMSTYQVFPLGGTIHQMFDLLLIWVLLSGTFFCRSALKR